MGGPAIRFKRVLSSKALFLVNLGVLLFFSVSLASEIINRRDLEKEISGIEQEISSLEGRNQELGGLIEYLKTYDFVEEVARTKLNLKKEGEKIIIVPEEKTGSDQSAGQEFTSVLQEQIKHDYQPNPVKWWNYFFSNLADTATGEKNQTLNN